MSKVVSRAAMCACLFALSGCMAHYNDQVVKKNPYKLSITGDLTGDWLKKYRVLPESTDDDKTAKSARRNQILNEFIWLADDAYYRWEPAFYSSGSVISTTFDFASLGLTGATTVANGPKVLGAMATGIQGANSSISKNFYDNQSRSIIVQKMRQLREAALIRIADGETKPVSDYSLDQGIVDIQNYYYAGTVTGALQGLATATGAQAQQTKTDLNNTIKKTPPALTIQ